MKWQEGTRLDPIPCKEKTSKFEITTRDGQARLGKLHTKHGVVDTLACSPQLIQTSVLLNLGKCGINMEFKH